MQPAFGKLNCMEWTWATVLSFVSWCLPECRVLERLDGVVKKELDTSDN